MRLIDIERMVDDYYKEKRDLHNVTWFEMTKYEVKAIPIEWIKKWCNEEHNRKSLEERLLKRYGVITMLEDWEKENEENI